ncbi:tetratricopeptide repeat protein [Roseivivax marinus]|uniref:tetratricopeptide repeat protein n=1 Tax=Roseivivax marinus TaxID=1379903 RepID=UPI000B8771A8|nr:tetratricopeptide repeat protein [Roseivivax marinus]
MPSFDQPSTAQSRLASLRARRTSAAALRRALVATSLVAMLALPGCRSAEEKAAAHFAAASGYLEEGDTARAEIELRNVLELTPNDIDARFILAGLFLEAGATDTATAHLMRLLETAPEHRDARIMLLDLALDDADWPLATTLYAPIADEAGTDPGIAFRGALLDYTEAVQAGDEAQRKQAHARLVADSDALPGLMSGHAVIADGYLTADDPDAALGAIDSGLDALPENLELMLSRVKLLYRLDRPEEVTLQMTKIVDTAPDRGDLRAMLVSWLIETDDLDAAEATLRADPEIATPVARAALLRFLAAYRGPDSAIAEIDRLDTDPGSTPDLAALRATLLFDTGRTDEAILEMRAVVAALPAGPDRADERLALVRMLEAEGDEGAAFDELAALHAESPRHVDAGVLYARRLIEMGHVEAAIAPLRTALGIRPDDVTAHQLIATAYDALGRSSLALQHFSQSMAVSNNAPDPTIVYARHLAAAGIEDTARDALNLSLLAHPEDPRVLAQLGALYQDAGDFGWSVVIEERLAALSDPAAHVAAEQLRLERLATERGVELALAALDTSMTSTREAVFGYAAIVRSYLAAGRPDDALRALEAGRARFPDSLALQVVAAALHTARGDLETAAQTYRAVLTEAPEVEDLWVELVKIERRLGDPEAARQVLDEGRSVLPTAPELAWQQALLETETGDVAAAIETYEVLLAAHPRNMPVRNNLARLLVTTDAPDALDRATEVAADLEGSSVPEFMDTYAWLLFRKGEVQAALPLLEKAAELRPEDGEIRLHAAEAHRVVGQTDTAMTHYAAAAETGTPSDVETARAAMAELTRLAEARP